VDRFGVLVAAAVPESTGPADEEAAVEAGGAVDRGLAEVVGGFDECVGERVRPLVAVGGVVGVGGAGDADVVPDAAEDGASG